jgi:phage shock protein A
LRVLATKYHSVSLAELAVSAKTAGHFDDVITMIDKMIALLREEEASDIEHRDRCQAQETANQNAMGDLDHEIEKTGESIGRMEDEEKSLQTEVETLEASIEETKTEMKELLDNRNEEEDQFKKALKDDVDAVDLLDKAITSLSAFYKKNKIPLELVQKKGPEYSVDQDKAPEASFSGSGSRKSESGGLIAILSMLKEDVEKEIKTARAEDAEAEADYEKDKADMQATLDATTASKVQTEAELADLQTKIASYDEYKQQKGNELDAQKELEKTLFEDCDWVKQHFDSRAEKRKTEIDGLMDAKNILAGAEPDDNLD